VLLKGSAETGDSRIQTLDIAPQVGHPVLAVFDRFPRRSFQLLQAHKQGLPLLPEGFGYRLETLEILPCQKIQLIAPDFQQRSA
jgi:hypothetical protein